MRNFFIILLVCISLTACKSNMLTNEEGSLFRDRANDYKYSPELKPSLTEPKGVKFIARNNVYEISAVDSNGPDILEADLPAEIILVDKNTGRPVTE